MWDVVPTLRGKAGKRVLFKFVVLFLPFFPFNLKLTDQTNRKVVLGDNRISPQLPFQASTPSLTDWTHLTGVDLGLSLSEIRGRGKQEVLFMIIRRVTGLLRKRMDELQEFWGVGRRWGRARGMVCLMSGWRNWA